MPKINKKKAKKILKVISTPTENLLDAVENDEPISKEEALKAYKAISTPEERLLDLLENAENFKGPKGESIVGPPGPKGDEGKSIIGPPGPKGDAGIGIPGKNGNEFEAKDITEKYNAIPDGTGFSVLKLKDLEWLRGRGKDKMQWSSAGFKVYTDLTLTGDGSFAHPLHSISADVAALWGNIGGTVTNQTDLTTYLSTNYLPIGYTPDLSAYVPYTGATGNVDLGVHNLTATQIIKAGGTSSQFLKADGSVDSTAYLTADPYWTKNSNVSPYIYPLNYQDSLAGVTNIYANGVLNTTSLALPPKAILTSDTYLSSLWHFENNGTDSKGSKNLTVTGSYTQSSRLGQYAMLGYGTCVTPTGMTLTSSSQNSWQLSGWVYVPLTTTSQTIASVGNSINDASPMFEVYLDGSGNIAMKITGYAPVQTQAITAGWHHIAIVGSFRYSTVNELKVMVDGTGYGNFDLSSETAASNGNTTNLYIGTGHQGNSQGCIFDEWGYFYGAGQNWNYNSMNNSLNSLWAAVPLLNLSQATNRNYAWGYAQGITAGTDNIFIGDSVAHFGGFNQVGNIVLGGVGNYSNTSFYTNAPGSNYNIVIGMGSLSYAVNAGATTYNTSIGYNAMFRSGGSGSNNNVAIGSGTQDMHVGNYNVSLGDYTLGGSATGDYNVTVGAFAGGAGKQNNVFLGACAGYGLSNTSSNNIFIGYAAGTAGFGGSTRSNMLLVGNQNYGSAAADLTNSIIYGVMAATPAGQTLRLNANVGINIAPTALLTLAAGTATAGTAPLKFTAGVVTTVAVSGQVETDASNSIFYTPASTRYAIPMATAANTILFTTTGNTNVTLPTSGTLFALPSLASGGVLLSDGSTITQDTSNFFWDATNHFLGLGTAIPSVRLEVSGATNLYGDVTLGIAPGNSLNIVAGAGATAPSNPVTPAGWIDIRIQGATLGKLPYYQ